MKKILFLFSAILICSCNSKSNGSDTIHAEDGYIETFKYKGHSYINFGNRGVVHDPDCQYCYNKFD